MKLQAKRAFNEIAEEFKENAFSLKTISKLIVYIREYRQELDSNEVKILLQIPIDILENDVELKSKNWAGDNSNYFEGNISTQNAQFNQKWKSKFSSKDFDIFDLVEFCKEISENFEMYRSSSEFLLRNVEVTLRDDVEIKSYSNFYKSGNIFHSEVLKVIGI